MKTKILIDNSPTYRLKSFFISKESINLFWVTQVNYNLSIITEMKESYVAGDIYEVNTIIFCNKKNDEKLFCFDIINFPVQKNFFFNEMEEYKNDELILINNIEELAYYFDKEIEKLNLIPKKIILLEKRIFKDSDYKIEINE
jgi:hypothetical protein